MEVYEQVPTRLKLLTDYYLQYTLIFISIHANIIAVCTKVGRVRNLIKSCISICSPYVSTTSPSLPIILIY